LNKKYISLNRKAKRNKKVFLCVHQLIEIDGKYNWDGKGALGITQKKVIEMKK